MITNVPNTEFLYFLADKNWKTFSIENGAVKKNALPTILQQSPIGWKELEISYSTNLKYWGLNKAISVPLTFVGDGAEILRYLLYKKKGYEEDAHVLILRVNTTDGKYYEEYFGKLDLSKANDDPHKGVTVPSAEGGLLSLLTVNESVQYEIKCDSTDPDAVSVLFDGVMLEDKYNYSFFESDIPDAGSILPAVFFNNEGDSVGIVKGDQSLEPCPDDAYFENSSNYLFYSVRPVTIKLKGTVILDSPGVLHPLAGVFAKTNLLNTTILVPQQLIVGENTFTFDATISLAANEKLFVFFGADPIFPGAAVKESKFSIEFNSINEDSTAYTYRPLTLLQKIVDKVTDGQYTAASNYFTTNNRITTTSGMNLRNLDNPVIKTSFADFFQSFDPDCNLGFKVVDNVLYVEPKDQLYNDSTQIFDLGEVADLEISVATDFLFNTIKSGSPSQQYDERNGRYEFNCEAQWKADVTAIKKELNLLSKYREDCYGIEFIRGKLNNKTTTDNKGDNECFKVVISDTQDGNGNFLLSRPAYSSMSGLASGVPITGAGAPFNTELSPKRKVLANANRLAAPLYQQRNSKIHYLTCDKNKDFATVLSGVDVDENTDIAVNKLGAPLFLPYNLKFKPKAPYTFSTVMALMNAGNIKLAYRGYTLYALPIGELSVKTASKEAQEWKLLCSPKSSLGTLFKLSANGLFITSYNNNMLFISNINPVHWLKYNHVTDAKHHHKDIYDDWVANRNDRMIDKPFYFQKWQKSDTVKFQFITANVGQLEVFVYDDAANQIATQTLTIQSNASIVAPYSLQEGSISLSGYDSGKYIFVLKAGSENLAISEWQHVAEDHEKTYLIEYSNTYNKQDGYFDTIGNFQLRVESLLSTEMPSGAGSDYEDESDNTEILHGIPSSIQKLYIGDQKGVPDWMGLKVNAILFLNRVQIEGIYYSKRKAEDQLEPNDIPGYPFHYYVVDVKKQFNEFGLTINDSNIPQPQLIYSYTLDAKAFGGQSGATINIQTTNT